MISAESNEVKQQLADKEKSDAESLKAELEAVSKEFSAPKVYKLMVPRDDSYKTFAIAYLKPPSRNAISLAMALEDRDPLKGKSIILYDAWLKGDEEIKTDDELFLSASTQLDQLTTIRRAILKKN